MNLTEKIDNFVRDFTSQTFTPKSEMRTRLMELIRDACAEGKSDADWEKERREAWDAYLCAFVGWQEMSPQNAVDYANTMLGARDKQFSKPE